jgi:prophage regulatory protein
MPRIAKRTPSNAPSLRIYRVKEVADLIGVHYQTIWKWAREGTFSKAVKISEQVTGWRASDVERWLDQRQGQRVA